MKQINQNEMPVSHALAAFMMENYPQTAENIAAGLPVLRGVWMDGDLPANLSASTRTTRATVVRAWSTPDGAIWTREDWSHDNGYQATLSLLDKREFLQAISACL